MIKVGIAGADEPHAGELIRLLVNHPDVDITAAYAPSRKGESVTAVHHGLLGEETLNFTDRLDIDRLDVLFICKADSLTEQILSLPAGSGGRGNEPLRIIDMSGAHFDDYEGRGMEYGLSEINRKPLVRGATRAVTPRALSAVVLIALHPLAANLILGRELDIEMTVPSDFLDESDPLGAAADISRRISYIQTSFIGKTNIRLSANDSSRGITMRVVIDCGVGMGEVMRMYDEIYDDHNFAWVLPSSPDMREAEGTQKCIIGLTRPEEGKLMIEAAADCRMRGGAGEAVHLMNLLCGLHEKTGLKMKAISF